MVNFMFAAATYSIASTLHPAQLMAVPVRREMHTPHSATFGYILNIQIKLNLDINQRSNKGGRLLLTRINVAFNIFLDIRYDTCF